MKVKLKDQHISPITMHQTIKDGVYRFHGFFLLLLLMAVLLTRPLTSTAADVLLRLPLHKGWNFFALPVTPNLTDLESFFQNKKTGSVWIFENGQYQTTTSLEAGAGYWVYLTEDLTLIYSGQPVDLPPRISDGWNIIAPYDKIDVSDSARGTVWTFDGRLFNAVTGELLPGTGYWVNLNQGTDIQSIGSTAADANSVPTYWKEVWGLGEADNANDGDRDQLSVLEEFQNATNPLEEDTDGDGIRDGVELKTVGSSPTNSDSDNDGVEDGEEDLDGDGSIAGDDNNNRILDPGETWTETNPANPDTDGDNVVDGQEVEANTNPRDPESVPPPTKLAFLDVPRAATAANPLAKVRVALLDQFGNVVRSANEEVSIDIGTNQAGGALSGTPTITPIDGIAEFTDLQIDKSGTGYTLAASTPTLGSAVSDPFDVFDRSETSIAGKVIDENNVPVPGARVTIPALLTAEEFTNGDGVFTVRLTSVPSDNSVCVKVVAQGFTTGEENVAVFPNETTSVTVNVKHIQVTREGNVADLKDPEGNIILETPDGAGCVIVPDPETTLGTTGNLCLELAVGNPVVDQDLFPGDFAAQDEQDSEETIGLASIVFGEIRVTNMDTGEPIEDLNGSATVILEIPAGTLNPKTQAAYMAGDTIEIWRFDEVEGMWKRGLDENGNEIDATVKEDEDDPDSGRLFAEFSVPHFSWWNVDVPIETHHCLKGRVVDQDDNPVTNAEVTATGVDYNGDSRTITDQNGNFCVDVMRGSTVVVGARRGITISQRVSINVPDVQSTCSTPQDGDNVCTPVEDLILANGTCVSGKVTDDAGNPVVNAIVEALGFDFWAVTDSNGNYCMDGLPLDSDIELRAVSFLGDRFVSQTASVTTPSDAAKCVDNTCVERNFTLDIDGSCIRGLITDKQDDSEDGRPLENVIVWSDSGSWARTGTGENAGVYCLTVPKNSEETIHISYWDPRTGILHEESRTINTADVSRTCTAGDCIPGDFELDLLTVGCISGVVRNESGTPIRGALVYVPGFPWGATNADGEYCITAPVRNDVTVVSTLFTPRGQLVTDRRVVDVTGPGSCEETASCTSLNPVLTTDNGCVQGIVQANGQPVADVRVVNSFGSGTVTDTNGAFCIEVIKGENNTLNFYKSLGGGQFISFDVPISESDISTSDTCVNGNCFDLGVVEGNRSPVLLQLRVSDNSVLSGETVTVTALATDADGDPLTYVWSGLGTIEGSGESVQWTLPNVATMGDIPISVRISDGQGGITSGSVTVTVTPGPVGNRQPEILAFNGNPLTLAPNETATISVDAVDPDDDVLTYTWTTTGGTINGDSATVNWTAPSEVGSYQVEVTVSDGDLSTIETLVFTVTTQTSGALSITVTEPIDLTPVAGARVILHDDAGDIVQDITTGTDGIARFGDIGNPRATFTVLRQKSESNTNNFDADWFALSAIDVVTGDLIIPMGNGQEDDTNDTEIEFDIVVENVPEDASSVFFSGVQPSNQLVPDEDKDGTTWTFRDQKLQLASEFITSDGTINITAAAFKAEVVNLSPVFEILKAGSVANIQLSSLNDSTVFITLDRDPQDIPFTANKPVQAISLTVSGSSTPFLAGFIFGQGEPQTNGSLTFFNLALQQNDFYILNSSSDDQENDCEFTLLKNLGNVAPTQLNINFVDYAITTITPAFESEFFTQVAWTIEGSTANADVVDIEIDGVTTTDDQTIEWQIFLDPVSRSLTVPELPADVGQIREPTESNGISSSIDVGLTDYSDVNGFDDFLTQVQDAFKGGRAGILTLFEDIFELGDEIRSAEKELSSGEDPGNGTNLSDHVSEIELISVYDYDFPEDPLRFEFEIKVNTDLTVNGVSIETAGGAEFTIERDFRVISDDISSANGRVEAGSEISGTQIEWFLDAAFDNLENFNNRFGDGTYVVTIDFLVGTDQSTTVSFTRPGSTDPIPAVTQNPTLIETLHNTEQSPPITVRWDAITDPAILNTTDGMTGIFIEGDRSDDGDDFEVDSPLPITDMSYTINSLSSGEWEIDLDFFVRYELTNADGIPLSLIKASESDHQVTIGGGEGMNLSDHILDDVVVAKIWDYGRPAESLSYRAVVEVETDNMVTQLSILTAAGQTYTISSGMDQTVNSNTNQGTVNLVGEIDGAEIEWELDAKFDVEADLDSEFGDGSYILTLTFDDGSSQATVIPFSVTGDGDAIAQPEQEPIFVETLDGTEQSSSFTMSWNSISDSAILGNTTGTTGIFVNGDRDDDSDHFNLEDPLPRTATSLDVDGLDPGLWKFEVNFFTGFESTNSDNISYFVAKATESNHEITVINGTGNSNVLIGDNFLDSGNTWEYDAINITSNGQNVADTALTMFVVGPSTITVPGLPTATVLRREVTSLERTEDIHFVFDDDNLILLQHKIDQPDEGYTETVRDDNPLEFLPRTTDGIGTGTLLGQGSYRGEDRDDPSDVWFGTTTSIVTLLEPETITVPAGEFTCKVIRQTLTWVEPAEGESGVDEDTFWIHPVKGVIRQISTASEGGVAQSSSTLVLRSTNID